MNDLIDRQAAIDALCEEYCNGHHDCKYYPRCENLRWIQELPSEQPERKKGQWVFSDTDFLTHCSNCGQSEWKGYCPTPKEATEWMPICPKCGADMRKETEDAVH